MSSTAKSIHVVHYCPRAEIISVTERFRDNPEVSLTSRGGVLRLTMDLGSTLGNVAARSKAFVASVLGDAQIPDRQVFEKFTTKGRELSLTLVDESLKGPEMLGQFPVLAKERVNALLGDVRV